MGSGSRGNNFSLEYIHTFARVSPQHFLISRIKYVNACCICRKKCGHIHWQFILDRNFSRNLEFIFQIKK
jgi:hypothetical protein